MTSDFETVAAAGNTEVPTYLTLRRWGFAIACEERKSEGIRWIASKDDLRLVADSPIELLGLATMRQERGRNWHASDEEIELFLNTFSEARGSE